MLKKKNIISIASLFMAVVMVILSGILPVSASENEIIDSSEKISNSLKEKLIDMNDEDLIAVSVWFSDID